MGKVYLTTSWDDGLIYDLKLASLLEKYHIPATFYIAPGDPREKMLSSGEIRSLSKRYEIGGHTLHHLNLTKISLRTAKEEIIKGKESLEDITGKKVISFAYPWGAVNSDIKQLVGFSGFIYARTISNFSTSLLDRLLAPTTVQVSGGFAPGPLLRGSWYRKLFYHFLLKEKITLDWEKWARYSLDYCLRNGGVFHLMGHSWELEKNNDWQKLERVFKYIDQNTIKSQRYTNGSLSKEIAKNKRTYYSEYKPDLLDREHETIYYKRELERLRKLVGVYDKKGVKVLDIGCGVGRVSSLFSNASYLGIDYSKKFINYARKKHQNPNRKFIHHDFGDIVNLRLDKQDLIIMWGLLEEETDPLEKMMNISSLLKKRTKIIFTLHNLDNPFYRAVKFIRAEFFEQPYSLTSFSLSFIETELKKFCKRNKYKYEITSLGLITPSLKYIPYIPAGKAGNTMVIILDKL